ncbi:MAG: NUDIX domain-containing protein, partial [Ferruginibacter sp.]
NQALMDFGAVVCKPQIPLCTNCALNGGCKAYLKGLVNQLPVKEKTIKKRDRWFYYYVIEHNDCIYVRKRGVRDIWENLYEFVLTEKMEAPISEDAWQAEMQKEHTGKKKIRPIHISPFYKQVLTHQTIRGQFVHIKIEAPVLLKTYELIPKSALYKLPFPKFISNYLKDKNVSLNLFHSSNDQNSIELISTS